MKYGVSIVIPTWNGRPLLQRFLPSVVTAARRYCEQSGSPIEVIIVDDCSMDDTASWLREQKFEEEKSRPSRKPLDPANGSSSLGLRLIKNESNVGFGESCNRGFTAATFELVLLLNNDVQVEPDLVAPLVRHFGDSSVFAVHCRVTNLEDGRVCGTAKVGGFSRGFIRVHQSYIPSARPNSGGPYYSLFAGGGSAMFDRLKLQQIGGFEPLLSPFYWEDVELSYRAWKRGYTVLYEPAAAVRHQVSSTIGRLSRRLVRRIEQRNRLIYHWIHLHDTTLLASHVIWITLLALSAPIRLKPGFLLSVVDGLRVLSEVRKRRHQEKASAVRTDREVISLFAALSRRPDLTIYDDLEQLEVVTRPIE